MGEIDPKDDAQRRLRLAYSGWPGTVWRHHKGGLYRVDSVVVDEETLAYRANYTSLSRGSAWSRPLPVWLEAVVVDGARCPRFAPHAGPALAPPAPPMLVAFGDDAACEVVALGDGADDAVSLKLSAGGRVLDATLSPELAEEVGSRLLSALRARWSERHGGA